MQQITNMKQTLKMVKDTHRRHYKERKSQEEDNTFAGGLSGWEEFGNPEDF
jgi:hypothetical protein